MSTVDERVVKMEFDNKSFEKNADQTMTTLDKLKSALNFNKVEKSFEKVTEAANKVDVSKVGEGVDAVKAKFSAMQIVGYTAIANITNRLMNFATRTVGGIWSQTVQGGIRRAFNIEKAKFTIEGLGKDWKKLSDDIDYGVKGTAYGFDEAAMAASSMAASGVKAGEDMKKALLGISGMAAMTGSSFSDISNIFTTVAGNGRLLSQQLNQFSSRGLNAAATLRDYINADDELRKRLIDKGLKSSMAKQVKEFKNATQLTEQNVRTLVSGSVIDFKTFSTAMHDAFGKQAKAANKTFNGVMSNIKATLSRIGEAFVHPLIANNDIDNMLNYVNTPLRNAANDAKKFWKRTNTARHQFFNDLKKSEAFAGKSNAELRKEWAKNPQEFTKLVNTIKGHEEDIPEFISDMMNTQQQVFVNSLKNTKTYANASEKELNKLYEKYYKVQNNIVGVLQAVKRVFSVVETTIKNSKFLKTFQSTASKACKALILLFNGLAASFGSLEKNGKKVLEIVGDRTHLIPAGKIWNRLRKTLGLTKDEFKQIKIAAKGLGTFIDTIVDAFKWLAESFIPSTRAMNTFREAIFNTLETVGRFFKRLSYLINASGIVDVISDSINFVVSSVVRIVSTAINVVSVLLNKILKSKGFTKLIKAVSKFGLVLRRLFNIILKVAGGIVDALIAPFEKAGDSLESSDDIIEKVLTGLANVIDWFSNILSVATTWIGGFVTKFNLFEVVGKISETVATAFGALALGAGKLFDIVKNFISDNLFSKFGNLFKKGSNDIKKGAKNIGDSAKNFSLLDFAKGIFTGIGDAIKNGIDSIKNFDFGKILEWFKTGFDNILQFLSDVKDKVVEAFNKIWSDISESEFSVADLGKTIADTVKNAFTNAVETISKYGPMIITGIGNALENIFSSIGDLIPEPNSFGVALGDFFAKLAKLIISGIPYLVQVIASAIRTIVSHLPGIFKELVNGLKEALKKGLFEPIVIEVNGVKREIPPLFDGITEAVHAIGDKFKDADIDDILNWVNKLLTAGVLNELRKLLKANKAIPKDLGNFLDGLGKSIDKKLNPGFIEKFNTFSQAIFTLVKALAVLAATLITLSYIPDKNLIKGGKALGLLALGLTAFAGALALINKFTDNGLSSTLAGLGSVMTGVATLVGTLMALTLVKKGMARSLAILAAIFIELGLFIFALKKIAADPGEIQGIAASLGGFTDAIKSLVLALVVMAQIPAVKMYNAIVELGLVMTEMGVLIFAMSKIPVTDGLKTIANLIPMVAMLAIMIGTLAAIKYLELDPKMLEPIGTTLLMIGAVIKILKDVNPDAGAKAALAVLAFVGVILGVLTIVGGLIYYVNKKLDGKLLEGAKKGLETVGDLLKWLGHALGEFLVGIGDAVTEALPKWGSNISGFFEALAPGFAAIGNIPRSASKNVQAIADAISVLVGTGIKEKLAEFFVGEIDFASFGERFKKLVGFMETVAEGLNSEKSNLNSKAYEKIEKLSSVIQSLGKVESSLEAQGGFKQLISGEKSFDKFGSSVKKLFSAFEDVGKIAGKIKNVEQMQKLSVVAKALSECMANLPDEKKGMFWMDMAGTNKLGQFGIDLVNFSSQLAQYVKNISAIDTSGLSGVMDEIKSSLNSIGNTKIKGMKSVGTNATKDLTSGFSSKTISKSLNSALSNAVEGVKTKGFKEAGERAAKAFATAISGYKKAKSAGKTLAENVLSGTDSDAIKNTAKTSGGNVAEGFVNGIATSYKLAAAYNAGKKLGNKALQGIKDAIKEGSPSKKAMKSGGYTGEGFVIGLKKWINRAGIAGKDVGLNAVKSLAASVSNEIEFDPVIRPVLDLSNVKMGANQINSMFNRNRYALGLAGSMPSGKISSPRNLTINNNMKVDGAENPAQWADEFMQEIEIQARTYNG